MTLHAYLPQDRLRILAQGETLPNRTSGSALFADISGFTALTESLRETLGARQGAEELSKRLGAAYSSLIAEVEKYGGSVIGFAGDAMICWFDKQMMNKDSSLRAAACAFGMQASIPAFPELGLKVAITTGDARRFVVGDPEIQKLDTLAGATVARTAVGEQLADKGDVLVDEETAQALGAAVVVTEWREDSESKERFAVVEQRSGVDEYETPTSDLQPLPPDVLKSWVHNIVFEREISGQSAFLTEFRPCVALFVRFTGIDYDSDSAQAELNTFIQQAQKIAEYYEGTYDWRQG
jgi:class 3 adenylate cyclase